MHSLGIRAGFLVALLLCGCSFFSALPTLIPTPSSTPTRARPLTSTRRVVTPPVTRTGDPSRVLALPRTTTATPTPIHTPTSWPLPSGRSECGDRQFRSATLGEDLSLYVYLPVGYFDQTQRRYPTVYLLSGLGGNYREWVVYGVCSILDGLIRDESAQPMIVVMPSGNDNPAGGLGSYWFNHAPPPVSDGKRWGDYIWHDVVNYIDANYRTLSHRESRAIGGLSAGGQGALTHALTHPEIFSAVGAHSPSFRRADGSVPAFGDPAYYNQYDPIWLVQNAPTWKELAIWIDDGDADNQWGTAIREYHALLVSLNIPHAWHIFPGVHDPTYWSPLVPTYLRWYSTKLTGQ